MREGGGEREREREREKERERERERDVTNVPVGKATPPAAAICRAAFPPRLDMRPVPNIGG